MRNKQKLWLFTGIGIAVAAAVGLGAWFYVGHNSSDPVYVYDFPMIGMTEFWGDNKESYGPVRTDRIQTILLSDTQTVTGIAVSEGDQVKKGDLLMTFDTTLSDLALERKRLEVEKLKLQLEDEQARLIEIRNMRPMVIPEFTEDEEVNQGSALSGNMKIYPQAVSENDGSTPDRALLCWIKNGLVIDTHAVLESIRQKAEEYQTVNAEAAAKRAWEAAVAAAKEAGEEPPAYVPPTVSVSDFYVVFKQTSNNMSLGPKMAWQGLHVDMGGPSFAFFDAMGQQDYSLTEEESADYPETDYGSGYTAAQLAEMRRSQEQKIREVQFQIKMTESEYKIMKTEATSGDILANFDGVVVSLLPEEEARLTDQPIMKVSGGGGFYIDVSISELEKDQLKIGQTATVMDYRSGASYDGEVVSVADYPTNNSGYYGMGNPNASYYPFTVFVDESASLIEGTYVNVQFSLGDSENGIYLENPFVRTENGRSYVYVQNESGKLEKRDVVTGKFLWGSYTEIRGGLSAEDKIAFPYGKNVRPGAATAQGDYSTLYG